MVTPLTPNTVPESLVQALLLARRIVVFTGAGMSAESGIATFRNTAGDQANSLWAQFNTRDMATPAGWRSDKHRRPCQTPATRMNAGDVG